MIVQLEGSIREWGRVVTRAWGTEKRVVRPMFLEMERNYLPQEDDGEEEQDTSRELYPGRGTKNASVTLDRRQRQGASLRGERIGLGVATVFAVPLSLPSCADATRVVV